MGKGGDCQWKCWQNNQFSKIIYRNVAQMTFTPIKTLLSMFIPDVYDRCVYDIIQKASRLDLGAVHI